MKLLVYVPLLTPRIKYIFNFIFTEVLKTQVGFSSNLAEFKASELPKMSYAAQPVGSEPFFKNADLLLAHNIARPSIKTTAFGDMIVPFAVEGSALPFDVFAAAFYFVSRYEEYLPHTPDSNGNYPVEASLQNKLKLLNIPVVDAWALILKNILLKHYPSLYFGKKSFEFIPLVCLYNAVNQENGGWYKSSIALFKKLGRFILNKPANDQQIADIHHDLEKLHEMHQVKGLFFLKPCQYWDHECDGDVQLPNSYLQLIKDDRGNDYRMGYAGSPGFRAGTCTPFYWYDLQLEKTTHLLVHPLAINDRSLHIDKHFRHQDILTQWENLIETVKLLNGHFYVLWHLDLLKEEGKGKAGRKMYTDLLKLGRKL